MVNGSITERIHRVQTDIRQAEQLYGRQFNEVKLLAVSKGHSISAIEQAFAAGLRDFGENYLQEALIKIHALSMLPIDWHYIGPIQSNKTKSIAENFTWIHSISRFSIAQRLNDACPKAKSPINICLQVNYDNEENKSGINPNLINELAVSVLKLPHLRLRGLMIIPPYQSDPQQQYLSFLRLTQLLQKLNQELNLSLDTLSMGMSDDLQAAIRAGSTIVRVGRSIFGERL